MYIWFRSAKKELMIEGDNTIVIGSGAREHALAWNMSLETSAKVYVSPGNAGTHREGRDLPENFQDPQHLAFLAKKVDAGLVVIGPEQYLADGYADQLSKKGVRVFGPKQDEALLETSKIVGHYFMDQYAIPHPNGRIFHKGYHEQAISYVTSQPKTLVLKADGLAGGKGVKILRNYDLNYRTLQINNMMIYGEFGEAGESILVQDFIHGDELSLIALVDGKRYLLMMPVVDFKTFSPEGPNTGGVASYTTLVDGGLMEKILSRIIKPTMKGLKKEKFDYRGALYFGLIIDQFRDPYLLEYNCRFGDPETQSQMILYKNMRKALLETAIGNLDGVSLNSRPGSAVTLVLASQGYPENPIVGRKIYGLDKDYHKNVHIFHAGTAEIDGEVVSNGGRVLSVSAYGNSLNAAFKRALYSIGTLGLTFGGMQYKHDIYANPHELIKNSITSPSTTV